MDKVINFRENKVKQFYLHDSVGYTVYTYGDIIYPLYYILGYSHLVDDKGLLYLNEEMINTLKALGYKINTVPWEESL